MTQIYLIRHAEAEGNLFRRAQGHWNGKITALGRRQIDALAARFAGQQIDAVYSSDLDRTVETAGAILRDRTLSLCKSERLREICMGEWEGQAWGELSYRDPEQMRLFNTDLSRWAVPGSESFDSVQRRMTQFVRELAARHEGQTVALVSHGMAIKILLMGLLGIPAAESARLGHGDNTSVSLLEAGPEGLRVAYYNDNSHLGDELSTFARQSWWRDASGRDMLDLRFVPLNPHDAADAAFYLRCYADSWREAHGSDEGFVPSVYLSSARAHVAKDAQSLLCVMHGETPAGVLELDSRRGREEHCGWVSLLYLLPEFRGKGLGVQLIGCAAAYFSRQGRGALRLHVADTNKRAIRFYRRYGFEALRLEPGVASDQLLMERAL